MSRQYHVYHLSNRSQADRIVGEVRHVEGVRQVEISPDLTELDIDMEAGKTESVMDRVVNICRKVSYECEVRYKFT